MKLLRCHIDNFGGLHNFDFVFSESLNIVLQENGWGKTTLAAFLKAMLFGFEPKRTRDIRENERRRYLPWQGGTYGGFLEFEADGKRFRVQRTFGEVPRLDHTRIIDLDKKVTAKIDPAFLGESIFSLDSSAFQRSVFISQNGMTADNSASSSIHTRLNALVSQANDLAVFDESVNKLTQQMKVYEKTGNRGLLGDISRQIAEKELQRDQLEHDISQQDSARERIRQIDALLHSIDKELEEMKKKLDQVAGEAKRQEASEKLLADIHSEIADLQKSMDAIRNDFGGIMPDSGQIELVQDQNKAVIALKLQIEDLDKTLVKLNEESEALIGKYGGLLPEAGQLDEIQSLYSELQGILSTGGEDASSLSTEPEGFAIIKAAVEADDDYIKKLKEAAASEAALQKLAGQIAFHDADIRHEMKAWEEKQAVFRALKAEVDQLKAEVEAQGKYDKDVIRPVIETLENLQKKSQLLEFRKEELESARLTAEQERFVEQYAGGAPDLAASEMILEKYRKACRLKSETDGLRLRLDGETSKAESLRTSLEQLNDLPKTSVTSLKKPVRTAGTVMVGIGSIMVIIGAVLTFMLSNTAMAAVIFAGAVLAIIGIISKARFKVKIQEYERSVAKAEQNANAWQKKKDIEVQLESAQAACRSVTQQISDLQPQIDELDAAVLEWLSIWAPGSVDVNEITINAVIEHANELQHIEKKQQELTSNRNYIFEATSEINAELKKIDAVYPEIAGLALSDALKALREAETAHTIKAGRLATAIEKKHGFQQDLNAAEDQLLLSRSPQAAKLLESRNQLQLQTNQLMESVNAVLSPIRLSVTDADFSKVLTHAMSLLNGFLQYDEKQQDEAGRWQKKQQQVEYLRNKLENSVRMIPTCCDDRDLPERLALVREDVRSAARLKEKISEVTADKEKLTARLNNTGLAIDTFCRNYAHATLETQDALSWIFEQYKKYVDLETARQQLMKQRDSFNQENNFSQLSNAGADEHVLISQVKALDEKRDNLLIEYTQQGSFIRQADQSLEKMPDVVQEIHQLYEEKQKAQNNLATLKRTIYLITKAKENLAARYLGKVEQLFNNYMRIWLDNDAIRGILDIDFNVAIEENEKTHGAEGYSTGYCAMIDFCMRLALVDTLFESEQPFLILDDPFVNLDEERLDKALELLNVMAANKQIIYFVCHPIRVIEKGTETSFRQEFARLTEQARQGIRDRHTAAIRKKVAKKTPGEMYQVVNPGDMLALKPDAPDFTITNNIFSVRFKLNNIGFPKDISYELFFIDTTGHVLCDRHLIEVKNGKLSSEKIQFCLNTRDDSGDQYELMIRESGQDDYEVVGRFPFPAKLAFAGTYNFDL